VMSDALVGWAEEFQAAAEAAAPAVAAGFAAQAAAKEVTSPATDALAAQVVADLLRYATPEQQQIAVPIDPQSLVDARSGAAQP
jgi:hypothetical protein